MVIFPNAKINIGLYILEKRTDGFHNIETVFYPTSWCDILEIIVDEKISRRKKSPDVLFKSSGIETYSPMEKNLCVRAYRLLKKDFPLKPVRIHLHKIIPTGAGLGGGSSDAAFAIRLLDKIFSLKLTVSQMLNYAGILGSDCAFFIYNEPSLAWGKGDIMEPVKINLENYFLVVLKPAIHINTAGAYANVKPAKPSQSLPKQIALPIDKWKKNIINDFEESVFAEHPELKSIKQKLYDHGAVYASMSGSGAAIYGIFRENKNVNKLFPDCLIWTQSFKS